MKLLVTADLHLGADCPRCRLDEDWIITQTDILRQIARYANVNKCPVAIVGDLFDTPKVPPLIESMFLKFAGKVERGVYILAGNHDLPHHQWDEEMKSSFGVVWRSGLVQPFDRLDGVAYAHWGTRLDHGTRSSVAPSILFLHILVFASTKELPPTEKAITAAELLAQYPRVKWIFTGDNHRYFHHEKGGRHVVNPGCILRRATDFKDYQPVVCLVDTEQDEVQPLPLQDDVEMVTDAYIKEDKARKDRIEAFIETVRTTGQISLDFQVNLLEGKEFLDQDTQDMLESLIEEAKGR